jgi:hypothetical protein
MEMRNLLNLMESGFDPRMHEMNDEQIRDLAREALDAAARAVQDKLGIDSGDVAGHFFNGEYADKIEKIFEMYIKLELQNHPLNDQE